MPDLLQILCAHCSGNQILVTWRYLFLRESNNAAQCTGKHPNPQCLSALHGATLGLRRIHNARTRSTQPHTGSATSPSTISGLFQELKNKKSVRIATFLRLGIVARRQNVDFNPKTQQKRHISGLEERGRIRNRKKVATMTSFLFLQWAQSPQRGRSRKKRAEYHDQQPQTRKKKGARYADASEKPICLESTLPWHRTARNKHRAQPSAYRRSPLRPELRGCTGAR